MCVYGYVRIFARVYTYEFVYVSVFVCSCYGKYCRFYLAICLLKASRFLRVCFVSSLACVIRIRGQRCQTMNGR